MNNIDDIKEIKINTLGQLLDFVETEEKAKSLIDYITNLLQENEDLKNQVEHLNELNHENEIYKIRCKRALKLVNNLISDDECFYIYDILESKKQELKHVLKGDYDE